LPGNGRIHVRSIAREDLISVGRFLHENLNKRIAAASWASSAIPSWQVDAPNFGFMLLDGDNIAGVHLAFYSHRTIDGESIPFCNLAAFCVLDGYRMHSLRLLRALLAQDGYHFTDLSPSGNVVPLNTRLHFKALDTQTALIPNLPWPIWSRDTLVISDRAAIAKALQGSDSKVFEDHAGAAAAFHALIVRGDEHCYVMFRRDRRKNLSWFASILHVGNPDLFAKTALHFSRHLLLRYGILATLVELRVIGRRPPLAVMLTQSRPKMFRSDRLRPEQIDNLYSELTCVAW
jgi:hypothetical protein